MFSVNEIQALIPEKNGLLMVDEVLECTETTITAQHKIQKEAPYFKGHFPDAPVVPGVLLVAGLQQTATLFLKQQKTIGAVALGALKRVKFRQKVLPGQLIQYQVTLVAQTATTYTFQGKVLLDGQTACQAKLCLTV